MISKAILMVALALSIALSIHATTFQPRGSRFLAQGTNPRGADHCHKDGQVCNASASTHCCNNKCVDLHSDIGNCGACKRKCKFTDVCCKGQCANLSFDKRHCGSCGNECKKGQFCVYGMCDYA